MRVSQFEIYRICQRALEGLGAPYGIDRDGASAAVWLEARGLPGLALLAGDLAHLERPDAFAGITPRMAATGSAAELEAAGRPAIAFCGAAVDFLALLALRAAGGRGQLAVRNCRSPLFFLPAAVAAGDAGTTLRLAWRDVAVAIGSGRLSIQLASSRPWSEALGEPGSCTVMLGCDCGKTPGAPETGQKVALDEAQLARAYDRSLEQGVTVEDEIWQRISFVAARVQVPASEASRLKGAGGGDANA